MKVGLMQPYFFPYIGQFQLINAVDRFILMDHSQYISGGWINRNRILHHSGGPTYITVPLKKHSYTAAIHDVQIVDDNSWKERMMGQLCVYSKAPFYRTVSNLVKECLSREEKSITRLNALAFNAVLEYLGMDRRVEIASELGIEYGGLTGAQNLAIYVTKQLGCTAYYNPPGGQSLYCKNEFLQNGLELGFVVPGSKTYKQKGGDFVPWLSIIDVMMFNSPSEVRELINDCEII